jgi:glyoxylase-like metal-dependent hydrolase (beta-lactamase superfamily II)
MPPAPALNQLRPGIFVWRTYHPAVKAELFSNVIVTPASLYLFDPIAMADEAVTELRAAAAIGGIIVTNRYHLRAASDYANKFSLPVFAHPDTVTRKEFPSLIEIADRQRIGNELEVLTIAGAAPGEIAVYHSPNDSTLIVGDALINIEPYGFTFLPRKYCIDEENMRRSLRKLVARQAERLLFAHGTPIFSGASARLRQLLESDH